MKRSQPLVRRTPLRAKGSRRRAQTPRTGEISDETRRLVMRRADYRCEVMFDGCHDRNLAPHHRLSRKHGNHEPENLVVVCQDCHTDGPDAIHRNPARSVRQGLIIPSSRAADPIEPWSRKFLDAD